MMDALSVACDLLADDAERVGMRLGAPDPAYAPVLQDFPIECADAGAVMRSGTPLHIDFRHRTSQQATQYATAPRIVLGVWRACGMRLGPCGNERLVPGRYPKFEGGLTEKCSIFCAVSERHRLDG